MHFHKIWNSFNFIPEKFDLISIDGSNNNDIVTWALVGDFTAVKKIEFWQYTFSVLFLFSSNHYLLIIISI